MLTLRRATEADTAEIRRLWRENPVGGQVPYYFSGAPTCKPGYRLYLIQWDGRFVGTISMCPEVLGDRPCLYASDAVLDRSVRGRGLAPLAMRLAAEDVGGAEARLLTAIYSQDNADTARVLKSQRFTVLYETPFEVSYLPALRRREPSPTQDYCALRNLGVLPEENAQSAGRVREGRRPAPLSRARGEGRALAPFLASARAFPANEALRRLGQPKFRNAEYEQVCELVNSFYARHALFTPLTPGMLVRREDFTVLAEQVNGRIVACVGVWRQQRIRRLMLAHPRPGIRAARWGVSLWNPRLDAAGEGGARELVVHVLTEPAFAPGHEAAFHRLLDAAGWRRDAHCFQLAAHPECPVAAEARRRLRFAFRSMFTVFRLADRPGDMPPVRGPVYRDYSML